MIRARWLAIALLGTTGCLGSCFGQDPESSSSSSSDTSTDTATETTPNGPTPSVDLITVPNWPPLGPSGVVTAHVSDPCCLDLARFTFRHVVSRQISGNQASIDVSGQELGEGLGTLWVDVENADDGWASRAVTDLLVDLTPPEADIGESWLRADGDQIQIWAGDAWVLGSVELRFQGKSIVHKFPEVYPATIGTAWDHSLESFPTSSFPPGQGKAEVTVIDAAGNSATTSFDLTLDGTPPIAAFSAPADGDAVSGSFQVTVDASDDLGDVDVELYAGGEVVATAPGPHATLTLDAADFAPGPLDLTALAIDRAGNVSSPAAISITLQ